MEKKIQLPKEAQPWTEVEVLFIDGCKVTVRYSRQKNPSAVKVIKVSFSQRNYSKNLIFCIFCLNMR